LKYSNELRDVVLTAIEKTIPLYRFDQYMLYPSVDTYCWQKYLVQRLSDSLQNAETSLFFKIVDDYLYMIGCRVSQWDEEHFGFKVAKIDWFFYPADIGDSSKIMDELLDDCVSFLRNNSVKFIVTHISGDDLLALHLFEDKGFRYYQTTVYPVARCTDLPFKADSNVRLWQEPDLPAVIKIARNNQFSRGHFYCDGKFDKKNVDLMYEKWIRTSWENKEPVAIIENEGKVMGYFVFVMDDSLSRAMKYKYGRMTSLSMDSSARGKGLGSNLFRAVMSLIADRGGQYIASEYPLKNFVSARLHTKNLFYPVHERVLLHFWL